MEFHEAANIFPIDDENIDALAADIREYGLQCPIELIDGKIVDGRRRWLASRMAGVDPYMVDVAVDDPVAYVLSLNLHRRHLTTSQKAAVAARAREVYDRAAKERMEAGTKPDPMEKLPQGSARDAAGASVGVSGKSVDYASKVLERGSPELVEAVDKGEVKISTAAKLSEVPEDMQAAALAGGKQAIKKAIETNERAKAEREPEYTPKASKTDEQLAEEAQADARRFWLKGMADSLDWIERFVAKRSDEHLRWYTEPESPGLFSHGLTTERVDEAIRQLKRVRKETLRRNDGRQTK